MEASRRHITPPTDLPEALAQPTRARLYAALRELRTPTTTTELARQLGMHPNGVRRHLNRLLDSGLVRRHRPTRGMRGRPPDAWSAATPAAADDADAYVDLARWLARAIPSRPGRREEIERAGRLIGRDLAPAADDADPRETGKERRAFQGVLTELGFQPELEASPDGRTICRLGHCPYADSVRENPQIICALHRGISEGVLESVNPRARMSRFESRDPDEAGCLIEIEGLDRSQAPSRPEPSFPSGRWTVDPGRSRIGFSIKHLMVATVNGRFKEFEGALSSDAGGPSGASGTVLAASVDTGDAKRDGRLRDPSFFDVERFPRIAYASSGFELRGEGRFRLRGVLTIKGVARELDLDCAIRTLPASSDAIGIEARGTISRSEFGLSWTEVLKAAGALLSDRVEIELGVVAVRTPEDGAIDR